MHAGSANEIEEGIFHAIPYKYADILMRAGRFFYFLGWGGIEADQSSEATAGTINIDSGSTQLLLLGAHR